MKVVLTIIILCPSEKKAKKKEQRLNKNFDQIK